MSEVSDDYSLLSEKPEEEEIEDLMPSNTEEERERRWEANKAIGNKKKWDAIIQTLKSQNRDDIEINEDQTIVFKEKWFDKINKKKAEAEKLKKEQRALQSLLE